MFELTRTTVISSVNQTSNKSVPLFFPSSIKIDVQHVTPVTQNLRLKDTQFVTCVGNRDSMLSSVNLCIYLAQFNCAF